MHNISIDVTIKMPAMNLARNHEIQLERAHLECFEIDAMGSLSFGEQHKVVKRVPMRMM